MKNLYAINIASKTYIAFGIKSKVSMIQSDLVLLYLVSLTYSNKGIPQTYRTMFCPLTSLCVWSSMALYLFSSFSFSKSQFKYHLLIEIFADSLYLKQVPSRYYHLPLPCLTPPTGLTPLIFLVIHLPVYYLSAYENVRSLNTIIFCLVLANDLPQCLTDGTFSINTNK